MRHTPRYADLADYIRATGDKQVNIAHAVGVGQGTISRLVAGKLMPRPPLATRLAQYADIPLDSFVRTYLQTAARRHRRRKQRCRDCGETDATQFRPSDPRRCKACRRLYNAQRKRGLRHAETH